jgi:HSP20 family protein
MEMIRQNRNLWDPFEALTDLQTDLNRAFNRSLSRPESWVKGFDPVVEVREEGDHFLVHADLPGVKKEDFSIKVQGSTLTLSGERKSEKEVKEKKAYYSERSYGSFTRTLEFPLEIQADKVKASYKDGVLEISLPKAESAKAREISVEVK